MMLEHLGQAEAARELEAAIESSLESEHTRTRDLGGSADTEAALQAVLEALG
jgi:tartrate dehydrogenase/decarboxylase/D-malate dehydrogenase